MCLPTTRYRTRRRVPARLRAFNSLRSLALFATTVGGVTLSTPAIAVAQSRATTPASAAPIVHPPTREEATFRRHFVGSSLFVLANALPDAPSFYQLNYGYRLSRTRAVSLEAITWRYTAPLGIPYGSSKDAPEEEYPGSVRSVGVGVAYQQVIWRGFYSSVHALPLVQRYADEEGTHLQTGFQLFTTLRVGYQLQLLAGRWFLEPSVAATAWPINTHVPASFAALDRKWNRYFLFEPGLHFGWRY